MCWVQTYNIVSEDINSIWEMYVYKMKVAYGFFS